jgi:hypothetical protein
MHRIYEWVKVIWREKINLFFKGATSGWVLSGVLLFGSNLSDKTAFLLTYLIKVFAVTVSGIISGFATVAGSDMYKWAKERIIKKRTKTKRNNNEQKTRIKRAS